VTEPVQVATAARPTTDAQRARVRRIVDVATMLVTTGGEDAVAMSDLPGLAGVSLAALYRYFPSKRHLLFAVVENHLESVLAKTDSRGSGGGSVRERTADQLLRGFHFDQKVPNLGRVVRRMSSLAEPAFGAERDRLSRLHVEIMLRAVGPMTDHQREALWAVIGAADASIQRWFAGIMPAGEVRFQIRLACRLLDLPEEQIAADRQAAEQ
jgi:TetR/AcrR family transcriptional regulator, cholesterol catabolism regulator